MNNLDYGKVFKVLVKETANYVKVNNLKAMVLGISGGIDSTVVAAICHEVSKQTTIPLIGRSLPIKNKSDEFDVSKLVGEAFCSDYNIYTISISDCVLHNTCYPLRKGTRVVVSMVSHYTQKGKAGFILETDYRTCLPYCVKWDDGSTSWVIGCTVTTETPEDSIIEESEEDIEIDLISENGFSREVTFYERN
jgi:hypothetical protein